MPVTEKLDEQEIARRLTEAGMRPAESRDKAALLAAARRSLAELGGPARGEPYMVFVPGRIELLGKHTDYAGGRSVLAAVERGFCLTAAARPDATIRVVDVSTGQKTAFEFSPDLTPTVGHWSNYPMTVARRLARNFDGPLRGADIALLSDLPPAAGMSSSSAMMIAVFKVLAHVNRLDQRAVYLQHLAAPADLAAYLATIENGQSFGPLAGDRGVGTFGGSEDHTAICCCRPGRLHVFSFCPVRLEQVIELPADYILAIASSGVPAEKTGEAMARYNRASRLVSALLELWNAHTGRQDRCLAAAARCEADAPDRLRQILAENPHPAFDAASLLRRFEQFIGENERIIPAACAALAGGDIDGFGRLVDESQNLAEELLRNQAPQTIHLARAARQFGAAAASAFGAGFGGSAWAMVKADNAGAFLSAWADDYQREYPDQARRGCFFLSGAGTGLIELRPDEPVD
jgi:galactokinase